MGPSAQNKNKISLSILFIYIFYFVTNSFVPAVSFVNGWQFKFYGADKTNNLEIGFKKHVLSKKRSVTMKKEKTKKTLTQ